MAQIPAPADWPTTPAKPEPGSSRRGGFGTSKPAPPSDLDPRDEELIKGRYADGGMAGAVAGPAVGNRPEPVPRVRDNLPVGRAGGDAGGHEVPPEHPMEWYERANPRTQGGGSMKPGPWGPYPKPPAGFPSRDVADLAELHRQNPQFYGDPTEAYAQGGMVKHGSATRITCRTKHG